MNPNETRQVGTEESDAEIETCPACGMEKAEWGGTGHGFRKEGQTYCCKGCAQGTGCTCVL